HVADPAPEGAERDRRVAGEGDDERRVLLGRDRLPLGPLVHPHGRRAREGRGDRARRLRGRRRRARRPRAFPPPLVPAPVAPASPRGVGGVLAATALAYVALAFVPDRTHRVAREASAWAAVLVLLLLYVRLSRAVREDPGSARAVAWGFPAVVLAAACVWPFH